MILTHRPKNCQQPVVKKPLLQVMVFSGKHSVSGQREISAKSAQCQTTHYEQHNGSVEILHIRFQLNYTNINYITNYILFAKKE